MRAASISLFGDLSRFGTGASEMPFLEQIHTNFISILLHLHEEPEVSKVNNLFTILGPAHTIPDSFHIGFTDPIRHDTGFISYRIHSCSHGDATLQHFSEKSIVLKQLHSNMECCSLFCSFSD